MSGGFYSPDATEAGVYFHNGFDSGAKMIYNSVTYRKKSAVSGDSGIVFSDDDLDKFIVSELGIAHNIF